MTTPTRLEVELPVIRTRPVAGLNGAVFTAVRIRHSAYIYRGKFYRAATVFADDLSNKDVATNSKNWPHPGEWFDHMAADIEASADLTTVEKALAHRTQGATP